MKYHNIGWNKMIAICMQGLCIARHSFTGQFDPLQRSMSVLRFELASFKLKDKSLSTQQKDEFMKYYDRNALLSITS